MSGREQDGFGTNPPVSKGEGKRKALGGWDRSKDRHSRNDERNFCLLAWTASAVACF